MELKSCPFCGSEDLQISTDGINYFVQCNDCLANGPECIDDLYFEHKDKAIKFWNQRK